MCQQSSVTHSGVILLLRTPLRFHSCIQSSLLNKLLLFWRLWVQSGLNCLQKCSSVVLSLSESVRAVPLKWNVLWYLIILFWSCPPSEKVTYDLLCCIPRTGTSLGVMVWVLIEWRVFPFHGSMSHDPIALHPDCLHVKLYSPMTRELSCCRISIYFIYLSLACSIGSSV